MGWLSKANTNRALFYLKRNGIKETIYAARERLSKGRQETYIYQPPDQTTLEVQRKRKWESAPTFSIVVPTFQTKQEYFQAMVESVLAQSYPYYELIIADASRSQMLENCANAYQDRRIHYMTLPDNFGIAENTNAGIKAAKGDYISLLDHDDILTPDALYEMALCVEESYCRGMEVLLLFSDEDKCSPEGDAFFEPHVKESFNLDLLLSNNYICHFMSVSADLMKQLKLRKEYEGSQDYDLALRCVRAILGRKLDKEGESAIAHVPKVLYHWRAHSGSTAENPKSKTYAYDAGLRAVTEFARECGFTASVSHMKHLGFYGVTYQPDLFTNRQDIAAEGGKLLRNGKIAGGCYDRNGELVYQGLRKHDSGYMHKAALMQDVYALDLRYICVNPRCYKIFEHVTGVTYKTLPGSMRFDHYTLSPDTNWQQLSMTLGKAFQDAGYRLLWNPNLVDKIYS
jgi:glycosyltransferase involved in cell wall biosynthesis